MFCFQTTKEVLMQRFIISMALVTCIILSFSGNAWALSPLNPIHPMSPLNPLEKDVKVKVIKTENQELWISFEDKIALLEQELRMCVFLMHSRGMNAYMKRADFRYCEEKLQQYFNMLRARDKAYKLKKLGEL